MLTGVGISTCAFSLLRVSAAPKTLLRTRHCAAGRAPALGELCSLGMAPHVDDIPAWRNARNLLVRASIILTTSLALAVPCRRGFIAERGAGVFTTPFTLYITASPSLHWWDGEHGACNNTHLTTRTLPTDVQRATPALFVALLYSGGIGATALFEATLRRLKSTPTRRRTTQRQAGAQRMTLRG